MYQAVSNLGAGGTQNVTLSDTANGVHYGMFAISGLFSGGVCNRVYYQCTPSENKLLNMSLSLGTPTHFVPWYPRICPLPWFSLVVSIGNCSMSMKLCLNAFPPSFQTTGTQWFVIFAGAIQGITAALLWSAQGEVMMSYPLEKDKGKMFGIFWGVFSFHLQPH